MLPRAWPDSEQNLTKLPLIYRGVRAALHLSGRRQRGLCSWRQASALALLPCLTVCRGPLQCLAMRQAPPNVRHVSILSVRAAPSGASATCEMEAGHQTIRRSLMPPSARKRFKNLKTAALPFGIKDPAIRSFVDGASDLQSCWSAKAIHVLNAASDILERNVVSMTAPGTSPVNGGTPSVSAIHVGAPPVSTIDTGYAPAPTGGGAVTSTPAPSPPSSSISGSTSGGSYSGGSNDYRTSGAGTNVTKDVLDFANAYARSAGSLNSVTAPAAPHVQSAPQVQSTPHTTQVYKPSGLSGGRH